MISPFFVSHGETVKEQLMVDKYDWLGKENLIALADHVASVYGIGPLEYDFDGLDNYSNNGTDENISGQDEQEREVFVQAMYDRDYIHVRIGISNYLDSRVDSLFRLELGYSAKEHHVFEIPENKLLIPDEHNHKKFLRYALDLKPSRALPQDDLNWSEKTDNPYGRLMKSQDREMEDYFFREEDDFFDDLDYDQLCEKQQKEREQAAKDPEYCYYMFQTVFMKYRQRTENRMTLDYFLDIGLSRHGLTKEALEKNPELKQKFDQAKAWAKMENEEMPVLKNSDLACSVDLVHDAHDYPVLKCTDVNKKSVYVDRFRFELCIMGSSEIWFVYGIEKTLEDPETRHVIFATDDVNDFIKSCRFYQGWDDKLYQARLNFVPFPEAYKSSCHEKKK